MKESINKKKYNTNSRVGKQYDKPKPKNKIKLGDQTEEILLS